MKTRPHILIVSCIAMVLSCLPFAGRVLAQPVMEKLEIGISTNEIAITSDFRGADITVFGAVDNADQLLLATGHYDVVVALQGPKRETIVRKKDRVFGIWVNRRSLTFEPIPTSYSMSSTRPLSGISERQQLSAREIGVDQIRLTPIGFTGDGSDIAEFREALLRLKQASGLFQSDPSGVDFVSASLFQATIRLPDHIPVGQHFVRGYLFKNGLLIGERELRLRVVKTGLEEFINSAAFDYPLYYGLFCVALACLTGWLASLVFRKD